MPKYDNVITTICAMSWDRLTNDEVLQVAKAYYYFSIQFRENLEIACRQRPGDAKLAALRLGECDTDNLSPWPKVAAGRRKARPRRIHAPAPRAAARSATESSSTRWARVI